MKKLFLLFLLATNLSFGQDFITKWTFNSGSSVIKFNALTTADPVNYTYTLSSGGSGSGSFTKSTAGAVTLAILIPAGTTVTLSLEPTNLRRFYLNNVFPGFLREVSQWGTAPWTSMATAFYGCSNLQVTATDIPNLSNVTDMSSMFQDAYVFNTNISSWNTSNVTNMSDMFHNAKIFNQNIGSWNTANVTNMSGMFYQASAFNKNIGNWNTANVTNMSNMFKLATVFNQDIGLWNTANVTNMSGMFYQASAFNKNIGNWNTVNVTNMSNMFNLAPFFNQNIGAWNTANVTNMSGMFYQASKFNQFIGNWNTSNVTNMSDMFRVASFFNADIGSWNTANVTKMSGMFYQASKFNQFIGNWNTSNVTDMFQMFGQASKFNQDIGNWSTANVTTMSQMFFGAVDFNQNIGSWNTSNVSNMSSMFSGAVDFNQNIGTWNTSNVTNMENMFGSAHAFNQDIGSWNTANVTRMSNMFGNATSFNQDIGSWNTSNVKYLDFMFVSATSFNKDIGSWNTASVINMADMFRYATAFNQDIGSWNTANVLRMDDMFNGAIVFNQNIGNWNTVNVYNMLAMFKSATAFNQDIGSWNTANVIRMDDMFNGATSFNQDIGNWNVQNVSDMSFIFNNANAFDQSLHWNLAATVNLSNMFDNSGLSCESYTDILFHWANLPSVPQVIVLGAENIQFGANGQAARDLLVNDHGWTITDAGTSGAYCSNCTIPVIASTIAASRCDAGTLILEATPSAGTINWYAAATGGSSLYTGSSFTTPSVATTTTYYAEAANGFCVNSTRIPVIATIGVCTQIREIQCGTTVTNENELVWATQFAGATAYRFEFTDPNNNVIVLENNTRNFKFSQFVYINNTTYSVRVAAKVNEVFSAYGQDCDVRFENLSKIQSSQCGATITYQNTQISASAVPGATAYRFEITDPNNNISYVENVNRSFAFSQFSFVNNTTYSVRVSPKTDAFYAPFSDACLVRIEQAVKIQTSQCGTQIPTSTTTVWSGNVLGATGYRFELTDQSSNVTILDNPTRSFKFNQFTYIPGEGYSVRVSAKTGSYYALYGAACNLIAPATGPRPEEIVELKNISEPTFDFEAFPNPSNGDFMISSSEAGTYKILNELGQLIRTVEIAEANNHQVKVENMPNGAYFVTGTSNGNVVTKKVIVVR